MKRLLLSGVIATSALFLVACGSDGAVGSSPPVPSGGAQDQTVSVMAAGGLGNILVDPSGKALYTPDEEADGTIRCVDDCTAFWIPLAPGATTPTAATGVPAVAVIARPDGTKQVTVGGRPLYTVSPDSPGKVTGDGAADAFGDQHFTWHVVHADGTTAATPAVTTPTSPAGGGYGY
jgi:predicted lipoprotein with Yx(FWY)xxD motif